ncbi:CHAT domain-containing protein [Sorangium sp. So ce295]|uniref:CHAT domain-containing protein n=1 Tax=Sorangium sp. So ce295 TaxID=3133295 RepID=UPI003F602B05
MPMWIEIEVDSGGQGVRVGARGSRGERPPAHTLSSELGIEALQSFASKVGRAVRGGRALDPAVVKEAQALYGELLKDDLRDVLVRLREASKDSPLLVRLFLRDRVLLGIPWEALCRPGTTEGFLGTDAKVLLARGVTSPDPWEPRDVLGAVRVLAIAPGSDERSLVVLKEALSPSIEAGEVEWLDPIAGPDISAQILFDRLRRGKTPHVLHWLGHGGVDLSGKPVLRVADDEDGEEAWITAEALGRELSASFCEELRLVILEACEGAKAGAFGSAAEILSSAGADAVVAHLWPVKADVARLCSSEIYRSLTSAERGLGDIGASVAAARRTLLVQSAEAFSPILFLRGTGSAIFDFAERRVSQQRARRSSRGLSPALQSLLERPFTMVLGDFEEDRAALKAELLSFMEAGGDTATAALSLSALTQRCALRFGQESLHVLFQQALMASLEEPVPPLARALARLVAPGVHITLLWRPHMERAIAEAHPQRNVFAIQPSQLGASGKPLVVKRAAGATAWKIEPVLPRRFDLDSDVVILRLYGGYSAGARPIFSHPVLTEDDHIHGFLGALGLDPPVWMEELLSRPRVQSGLFVGLSALDFRHRMLLRWLYDQRQAPSDSLAILTPDADASEPEIWEAGCGLPGGGRIASVVEDPELVTQLEAFTLAEVP